MSCHRGSSSSCRWTRQQPSACRHASCFFGTQMRKPQRRQSHRRERSRLSRPSLVESVSTWDREVVCVLMSPSIPSSAVASCSCRSLWEWQVHRRSGLSRACSLWTAALSRFAVGFGPTVSAVLASLPLGSISAPPRTNVTTRRAVSMKCTSAPYPTLSRSAAAWAIRHAQRDSSARHRLFPRHCAWRSSSIAARFGPAPGWEICRR
mmetsp:Transcript_13694/g.39108  ORF Transcript_13694/g.39108 Transcript_13694/m.39108 type:complete len:207 (+) Transcript_13694:254-874(+)